MSGPSGERCGFCYFCADPSAANVGSGWCKRYPPPHTTWDKKDEEARAPEVGLNSWCGEFRLHPKMQKVLFENLLRNRIMDFEGEVDE